MSFFSELKRRQVLRTTAAYVAAAWLLVQVADTVFEAFELGEEAVRLVIIVLALGLIPVIILSWVFQLTPEGLQRDSGDSAADAPVGRNVDRIIIVLLAAGVTFFAFDKFVLDPQRDEEIAEQARTEAFVESYGDKSIAVLAFADLSADGENEYFSDGIAEEMINLLAKIPELRVISRSSAFSYKGRDLSIPQIAEELNVTYVLEGSVRKAGDQIRVTAQLIDARTDTHLYSENFDRAVDDIFVIQDEISASVVNNLKVHLTGGLPHARPTDPEAHALLLRAKYISRQMRILEDDPVEELLLQALEIDPYYLDAIHELISYYIDAAEDSRGSREEALEKVRQLIDRAKAIDPDNGYTIILSAYPDGGYAGNIPLLIQRLQEGLAKGANDLDAIRTAAEFMRFVGRLERSTELMEYVIGRDPLCQACMYRVAFNHMALGNYAEAENTIREFRHANEGGKHTLGTILFLQGRYQEAADLFATLEAPENPHQTVLHGKALTGIGLNQSALVETALAELEADFYDTAPLYIAEIHALLGENDAAFAALDHAFAINPRDQIVTYQRPLLTSLHDDPRWQEFRNKTNSSEEAHARMYFEIELPGED